MNVPCIHVQFLKLITNKFPANKSKSTLESLKSVFNVFRRKPSLGAPVKEEHCTALPCMRTRLNDKTTKKWPFIGILK